LLGNDFSITKAVLVITTLMLADRGLDWLSFKSKRVSGALNDRPLVLVDDGKINRERLERHRIKVEDVLEAARASQGVANLEQIRFAVLERDGRISVIRAGGS
jgi:uncharacterized membrane protein YcaP (DUF421 family)